jgi:hypothetical protein
MALLASGLVLLRFAPDSGSVAVPEGRRLVISSSIVVTTRRRAAVRRPTAAPLSYRTARLTRSRGCQGYQ